MELKLYHRWSCPYSQKVRDFIDKNNLKDQISYIELDESPEARETVKKYTGKEQTPCLVINGKPLLESSSIITWLNEHLLEQNRAQI